MTLSQYESQDPIHRAEKQKHVPGGEATDAYQGLSKSLTLQRVLMAFTHTFHLPHGAIKTPFRELLTNTSVKFPKFRCSAARALIEGRIPGLPQPFNSIPHHVRRDLDKTLYLLDIFDTIVQLHFEEIEKGREQQAKKADQVFEQPEEKKERLGEEKKEREEKKKLPSGSGKKKTTKKKKKGW